MTNKPKIKAIIKIEVSNIVVDERYYYFDYKIDFNGKKKKGRFDDSYDSQSAKEMKKVLEKGWAIEQVIDRIF